MRKPRLCAGAFSYCVWLEWADAVVGFIGQGWFGVACEGFLVFDCFTGLGEPVAWFADVAGFHVVGVLGFVAVFDGFVYFLVLCVYLFFGFVLCFDEVLVGGGEVCAMCGGVCDGSS